MREKNATGCVYAGRRIVKMTHAAASAYSRTTCVPNVKDRKQLGSSLGRSMKMSHKKNRDRERSLSSMKSQYSRSTFSDKKRDGVPAVSAALPVEKAIAKVSPVRHKNGASIPEHRKRRDSRPQCDIIKAELKEKPHKLHQKTLRTGEPVDKTVENKKTPSQCSNKTATIATKKSSAGNSLPKYSGSIIKIHCNQTSVKVPTSPVKNWGGFRIPKKGERQPQKEETCQSNTNCQYMGLVSPNNRTKDKLKLVSDNDGYTPDAEMSDSETESTEKCPLQRLSSSRGYKTDIIRRSILAS
ncbi:unnamed protein product [Ranitomeya imitator]|uniref:Uncharacterized protein n=1 Tax=Ranitomeya imitator TaxID=111125 RepID=A0ABN9LK44_9NEOB|nr:unnamed protein product [Ranitomeya imitator]